MEHVRAQGDAWPSPLHCCTGDFYLPLRSFTEQINKLAVAFCCKVLVPFLAEWQATPSVGSRAAQFRLFICKVSRLVALGCRNTVRDLKEKEAQSMAADSLTAWRPFTGSSEAQMSLLVLEKGRTSLKRMKADIARGIVAGDWALFLATALLWGFQECATSCLAVISAPCCNSLS